MRYKLVIAYDGSNYHGFQRQDNLASIQEEIEKALSKIFKEEITIHGAGRTDALVHAYGQVIHFDGGYNVPVKNLIKIANKLLYPYIYVLEGTVVSEEFHARKSAISKEYRYYLNIGPYNPLKVNYQYFFHKNIDFKQLEEAMSYLVGTHDFRSFAKANLEKNTIRTVTEFSYHLDGDVIEFIVKGNGFLRHMVRIMIAVVLKAAEGKFKASYVKEILDAKNRLLAPYIAPATALYLWKIDY